MKNGTPSFARVYACSKDLTPLKTSDLKHYYYYF